MRKWLRLCWAMLCFALCVVPVLGAESGEPAEDISGRALVVEQKGFPAVSRLFDGYTREPAPFREDAYLTLQHEGGIGSLYLVYDVEYGEITVTDENTGECKPVTETGFLHVFLDLTELFGYAPRKVTLGFESGAGWLNELYAFTAGQVPGFVQKWQPPVEGEADLVLFSSHGDDEQLFFAGLLPYYAAELDYHVQVVYLTGHRNMSMRRSHEMLDGLWAVGVKTYPVFGGFGDYMSASAEEAMQIYENKGHTREALLKFVVENIRRFRPKVAVGHDLQGEYGHGMHMLYARLLCQAVEIAGDAAVFPDTAERYGIWDVPKTYLHLYPENRITMDWDLPLDSFGGMTGYEVTKKLGFPCHSSQQTYYSWYFSGYDTAAEIPEYSPCEFGLFRSTVGQDAEKNDFFENVMTHEADAREAARKQAEEASRKEETEPSGEGETPTVPAATAVPPPEREVGGSRTPLLWLTVPVLGVLIVFWMILKWQKK